MTESILRLAPETRDDQEPSPLVVGGRGAGAAADPIERSLRAVEVELGVEVLTEAIEAFPGYRVVRELVPRTTFEHSAGRVLLDGLVVQVETTGTYADRDEILDMALVPFKFTEAGSIVETGEPFLALNQPRRPIPDDVARLTGITDQLVHNLTIPLAELDQFVGSPSLVVAHGAARQRPFVERLCPELARAPWFCSLTEVDWPGEGVLGGSLPELAHHHGTFYLRRRAVDDCRGLLEILSRPLPSGPTGFAALISRARTPSFRVWAAGAVLRDGPVLRGGGFSWSAGRDGRRRGWFKDVAADDLAAEVDFLTAFFCEGLVVPIVDAVDPYVRFSARQQAARPD